MRSEPREIFAELARDRTGRSSSEKLEDTRLTWEGWSSLRGAPMAIVRLTARVARGAMFASRWTPPPTPIRARPPVAPPPVAVGARFHHRVGGGVATTAWASCDAPRVQDHRRRIAPLAPVCRPLHSFAALRAASADGVDPGKDEPPAEDDGASTMDEDEDHDEDYDEDEDEWDPANVPFLVGAGGDGVPAVEVDVLVVEDGGKVETGVPDTSAEDLADALRADAETLIRALIDPPSGSALPRGVLLRGASGTDGDGSGVGAASTVSYCELSVALCDDGHIRALNKEWRGKDSATDVLSFPADSFGDVVVLGDCVISIDTARRQAQEVGHGLLDECRVLLVHGLLHLCGFDHETGDVEAAEMSRVEDELLGLLSGLAGTEKRAGLVGSSLSGARASHDLGVGGGPGGKGESSDARGIEPGSSEPRSSDPTVATVARSANAYGAGAGGSGSRKADCLVLDLDGTLLNRECVITPRTAEALRECAAAGVVVFIATGKARPAAIRAAATAGLDGDDGVVSRKSPGVFIQGLDVYGREGDPIYKAEMPHDVVREAFGLVYGQGLSTKVALTAFCGDECATLASHPLLDELSSLYHEPKSVAWDDVDQLVRAANAAFGGNATASGVQKLLLMAETAEEIDAARPRWEALFGSRAEVTQAVPNMLEILPLGNDKARGVRTLLTHLDVDVSRVVAVGDGENDLGMLRLVGRGVAMGNAGAKVKAAARETLAATNDEDGVAEAIQRFVL